MKQQAYKLALTGALSAAMLLALAGCGGTGTAEAPEETAGETGEVVLEEYKSDQGWSVKYDPELIEVQWGGGATDFRLVGGAWNDFDSLKSRIMVAGGAGGQCSNFYWHTNGNVHAGYGGGLSGYSYASLYAPGTQTSGHAFGYGKDGVSKCEGTLGIGGGGGGYYGGSTQTTNHSSAACSGAGGSAFISGHTGCNAIEESSTAGNITHSGTPNHYSGLVFTDTVMKSGNESMPTHNGSTETGHRGNGVAKIQRLSD